MQLLLPAAASAALSLLSMRSTREVSNCEFPPPETMRDETSVDAWVAFCNTLPTSRIDLCQSWSWSANEEEEQGLQQVVIIYTNHTFIWYQSWKIVKAKLRIFDSDMYLRGVRVEERRATCAQVDQNAEHGVAPGRAIGRIRETRECVCPRRGDAAWDHAL